MSEVCHDVKVGPVLQPLTGETHRYKTAIRDDDAHLDICASGFKVLDINMHFLTFMSSIPWPLLTGLQHCVLPTTSMNRRSTVHMRKGFERLSNGCFTPLVFSTSGGMGKAATIAYKRLANLLSTRRNTPYHTLMGWLCCPLNFSLLKSSIMCIRGFRLCSGHLRFPAPAVLILAKSRVSPLSPPLPLAPLLF